MNQVESREIVWLFDIDGTLIRSGGAGGLAMARALESCFGAPPEIGGIEFSGRTDRGIAEDLFDLHGIESNDDNIRTLFEGYQKELPAALEQCDGEVLPGVVAWLERIKENELSHLGLLTGNMSVTAQIKLQHFGIWEYFSFGGYGDNHCEREKVAREALLAASEATGNSVHSSNVWVVGDTPHDVFCGKSQGLNVLCVATGVHSYEELLALEPNIILKSLHDDAVLVKILGGQRQT